MKSSLVGRVLSLTSMSWSKVVTIWGSDCMLGPATMPEPGAWANEAQARFRRDAATMTGARRMFTCCE